MNLRTGEVSYDTIIVRTTNDHINAEHAQAIRTPLPSDEPNVSTRSVAVQTDPVALPVPYQSSRCSFQCNWICVWALTALGSVISWIFWRLILEADRQVWSAVGSAVVEQVAQLFL